MTTKISALQQLATAKVGDGKNPNLYFVTDKGVVTTISQDFDVAYKHWKHLSTRIPLAESALEDRLTGVLASVEPISDERGAALVVHDDVGMFKDVLAKRRQG